MINKLDALNEIILNIIKASGGHATVGSVIIALCMYGGYIAYENIMSQWSYAEKDRQKMQITLSLVQKDIAAQRDSLSMLADDVRELRTVLLNAKR